MTLAVVVMGRGLTSPGAQVRPWGSWDVHPWDDVTELALDPYVRHPETTHVLVVSPAEGLEASSVCAALIASQRPEIQVRVEETPFSVGAVTQALERVPEGSASATAVHAALHQVLAGTTLAAWMPSVTKLAEPAPTMGQHVRSWFGGNGFLAVRGEPGWVARLPLQTVGPDQRLAKPAAATWDHVCRADGEVPEPAIDALFKMGLASRPQRVVPAGDAEAVWGSKRAVELVLVPDVAVHLGPPDGVCQVCHDPVWGMTCPFCRIVLPRGAAPRLAPGGTR